MSKGEITRAHILNEATLLASKVGIEGLSIGALADQTGLSKSGLFAHFGSKENLQIEVLRHAGIEFIEQVVEPALKAPRGLPRVEAIFSRWLEWAKSNRQRGGCVFVAAAAELDDRPGPARDELVKLQEEWSRFLRGAVQLAIDEGHLGAHVDAQQLAFEIHAVLLGYHFYANLLRAPRATERADKAFRSLISSQRSSIRNKH